MEKALARVAALENELAALRGSAQKPNDLEEERKRKEAQEEMKRKVSPLQPRPPSPPLSP